MSLVKGSQRKEKEAAEEKMQEDGNRKRAKVRELLGGCGLPGADNVLRAFLCSLKRKFGFSQTLEVHFNVIDTHPKESCEAWLGSEDRNNSFRKARVAIFKNQKTGKFYVIGEIFLETFGWRYIRRGDDIRIYFGNLGSLKRCLANGANDLLKEFGNGKAQAEPNNKKKIRNKIVFANN